MRSLLLAALLASGVAMAAEYNYTGLGRTGCTGSGCERHDAKQQRQDEQARKERQERDDEKIRQERRERMGKR